MTIRTTNGEQFSDAEHRALARLMFKRFGRNEESFCMAWRRMLQNSADNADIMKLVGESRPQERAYLKADLMRNGTAEVRQFQAELLDTTSCEILRRHLQRVQSKGESDGRRRAITQPWRR